MALPSGAPTSSAHARRILDQIKMKNGFLSENTLSSIPQKERREVEAALLAKDIKIGSSVLALAKNLYTSNARFVFELLQNTEDNQYSVALAGGEEPFASFSIFPDRIVVDCNEDGFTEDNLTAISDIGNSSKSSSQGYIGEKGIGFKSVFMAAWKVHIHSGHLSFSFVHRKGDSGMGMVSPVWEEPTEELPRLNHTRMTLFLHEGQDEDEISRSRDNIQRQFLALEPAFLLFVSKLKRIDVLFHDQHGQQFWARRLSRRRAADVHRVVLEIRLANTDNLDNIDPEAHSYHVTEHMATNVARHENRDLSVSEAASPSSRQSKIVLAFPVSSDSVPVIKPQKVFAFLPMRLMGFNFLIQADFVTQASREDIVTSSQRNKDLVQGVIDAMMKAIRQLCKHEFLQYTWMRYLPRRGENNTWDSFWLTLVNGLEARLQKESTVRTRGVGAALRRIHELSEPPEMCYDRHGHPLFRDLDPEVYISGSYQRADLDILHSFGLQRLAFDTVMRLVRWDLSHPSGRSKLLSPETEEDWHTRASALLLLPWENGWELMQAELRTLPLIPLNNGSWRSVDEGDVFHGVAEDIPIPKDLGLNLVDTKAAMNAKRRDLFRHLGVKLASTDMIRSLILTLYAQRGMRYISIDHSLEHLKFLYHTHQSRPKSEPIIGISVYDHRNVLRPALEHDLYVQDNHPYGAQCLLGPSSGFPSEPSFVNSRYFESSPRTRPETGVTWIKWMHDYVGVRRKIRLLSHDRTSLSEECKHIAEHHSDKFLGFLKHVWAEQGQGVTNDVVVATELQRLRVPCTNGAREPFSRCYMPLERLKNICRRFTSSKVMRFLSISSSEEISLFSEWWFLSTVLGVAFMDDLSFRLDLLEAFLNSAMLSLTIQTASKVLELYQYIESWCVGAENPEAAREHVRERFGSQDLVLVPSYDYGLSRCLRSRPPECLWEAPCNFSTMQPLKALYGAVGMRVEKHDIRQFFQETLRIPDIAHDNITKELESMKRKQQHDIETVGKLYQRLQKMYTADTSIAESLRDSFEKLSLVYVGQLGSSAAWFSPSACLWSSPTRLAGKAIIDGLYPDLKLLFTKVLGVSRITLDVVYESLLKSASVNASANQMKRLLLTLNSLLPMASNPPRPDRLLQSCSFPVRAPGKDRVTLVSCEAEFFIIDRDDMFAIFGNRVRCLDFSLHEVCLMKPFIEWAGLESKYLSRCIEEVSRVHGDVQWPIRDRKRDIRRKAYGLLRIAARYGSPRYNADPQGLYSLLRTAVTVEAAGISSTLVIRQDGKTHEHEVSQSDLHIQERNEDLNIYVPHDEDAWDDCFLHALPLRLLSWMMAPPGSAETTAGNIDEAALGVVIAILTCSESAVPSLLKRKGVPKLLNVLEEPLSEAEEEPFSEAGEEQLSEAGEEQLSEAGEAQFSQAGEAQFSQAGEEPQIYEETQAVHAPQVGGEPQAWWASLVWGESQVWRQPQVVDKPQIVGELQVMDERQIGEEPQSKEEPQAWEEQQVGAEPPPTVQAAIPATSTQHGDTSQLSWGSWGLMEATHPSRLAPASLSFPDNGDDNNDTGHTLAAPPIDGGEDSFYEGHEQRRLSSWQGRPVRGVQTVQGSYRQLLASAIAMAGKIARQYSYGWTDLTFAFDSLVLEAGDEFNNPFTASEYISSAPDRRRRIGAAGELFVFEFLSNLDPLLPSFSLDNWRSTIRHCANEHPKYSDLAPFVGNETSDIVYDDASGVLTALLIHKEHLSNGLWEGKTPRYYIEVKSTLSRCETPFYVSQGQAERMIQTTNGPSGSSNQHEVYAVFRVFNLGTESTGLRIYLDPEEQRRTGKLRFATTVTHAVVPAPGV